jgi:hypothetical protein
VKDQVTAASQDGREQPQYRPHQSHIRHTTPKTVAYICRGGRGVIVVGAKSPSTAGIGGACPASQRERGPGDTRVGACSEWGLDILRRC